MNEHDCLVYVGGDESGEVVHHVMFKNIDFSNLDLRGPVMIGPKYSNCVIDHDELEAIALRQGVLS